MIGCFSFAPFWVYLFCVFAEVEKWMKRSMEGRSKTKAVKYGRFFLSIPRLHALFPGFLFPFSSLVVSILFYFINVLKVLRHDDGFRMMGN